MDDEPEESDESDDAVQNVLAVAATAKDVYLLLTLYDQSNALNPDGQVYRTTRQRDADSELILSANDALSCLFVSPAGRLWVASAGGNVYTTAAVSFPAPRDPRLDVDIPSRRYSWRITTLPDVEATGSPPNVQSLWGSDDSSVFAATAEGAIFRWDGTAWAELPTGVDTELIMLHGASADDVYCVGDEAVILHYDGRNWTRIPAPEDVDSSDILTSVWAASREDAYACSAQGKILKGNRNGFKVVAEDDAAAWYGATVFNGKPLFASSTSGAWELTPSGLSLIRDRFNPVGVFDAGDRLYFIETDQPSPRLVEYAPGEAKPWGRRVF